MHEDIDNIPINEMEFEQAIKELEGIVKSLQDGCATLKSSVELYERGILLKNHCETLLNSARMKIEQITKDKDGNICIEKINMEDN